jgi:hypothetical protein
MNTHLSWVGAVAVVASLASSPLHRNLSHPSVTAASPCTADSNYQRLSFWVGDWAVLDSLGARYATQRVHSVVDDCAITVDWTSGGGNKGLGMYAYDRKTGVWKQIYVSNQLPTPSGVSFRASDPSYAGPGVRFVSLDEAASGNLARSRTTIMPMGDHRAMQLFEDSPDGGKTWHVVFKAEDRPLGPSES